MARPATSDADGSDLRVLDANPDQPAWLQPAWTRRAWSPDGSRFVVTATDSLAPDHNGIYTLRASDGAGPSRLTVTPSNCLDDAMGYSPDGSRMLFKRVCGAAGAPPNDTYTDLGTLFVVGVDGTVLTRLSPAGLEATGFTGMSADWSPDGSAIVFTGYVPSADSTSLFTVHPDGSELREIGSTDVGGYPLSGRRTAGTSRSRAGSVRDRRSGSFKLTGAA